MTGIILAGGEGLRFNRRTKALLKIKGKTIIERLLVKLSSVFDDLIIITNNPELCIYPIRAVKDIFPNKGSIGGLYTGLMYSKTEYNFVVASDMPFLNVRLIKYIKNICNGFDVVVPKVKSRYEPLHAIYSKNCAGVIGNQLGENNLKITDLFQSVRVKEIGEDVIKKIDPEFLSFFNINTPEDYQKALKLAKRAIA